MSLFFYKFGMTKDIRKKLCIANVMISQFRGSISERLVRRPQKEQNFEDQMNVCNTLP